MILITGASSGLGAELAKQYSADSQPLFLTGRSEDKLAAVAAKCKSYSRSEVSQQTCQLHNADAVASLLDVLPSSPKLVIHCAGSGYFGELAKQESDAINVLIENNLTSSIMLVKDLVQRYQDEAVTVAVVMSTAAQVAKAGESTYCAVKWAIRGFIESVRLELKGKPMKLVAVYPGGMATEFWQTSGSNMNTASFMTAAEAASMLKQALTATEHGYVSDITINRS